MTNDDRRAAALHEAVRVQQLQVLRQVGLVQAGLVDQLVTLIGPSRSALSMLSRAGSASTLKRSATASQRLRRESLVLHGRPPRSAGRPPPRPSKPPVRLVTFEAQALEHRRRDRRARAGLALHDDRLRSGGISAAAIGQVAQRDVNRARQVAGLPFGGAAHVDHRRRASCAASSAGVICGIASRHRHISRVEIAADAIDADQRQRPRQFRQAAPPPLPHRRSGRTRRVWTSHPAHVTNDALSGMLIVPGR